MSAKAGAGAEQAGAKDAFEGTRDSASAVQPCCLHKGMISFNRRVYMQHAGMRGQCFCDLLHKGCGQRMCTVSSVPWPLPCFHRTRITLSMMGLPLTATFDSSTETLIIAYKEQEGGQDELQPAATSAQLHQQRSSSSDVQQPDQQQPSSAQLGLNNDQFNLQAWLDHMQGKIINRQHIPKAQLPLQVSVRVLFLQLSTHGRGSAVQGAVGVMLQCVSGSLT